jgi:hypothetical protein
MGHVEQPPIGSGRPAVRLTLGRRPPTVSWRPIRNRFERSAIGWLAIFSLVVLVAHPTIAQEFIVDRTVVPVTHIDDELSLLIDPSGKLEIEDVKSPSWRSRFQKQNQPAPVIGFTPAAVWARLKLRSIVATPVRVQVTIPYARLSHLTWYVVANDRVEQQLKDGSADPPTEGMFRFRFPAIEVDLAAGEGVEIYVRAASDTSIIMQLHVGTIAEVWRYESTRFVWGQSQIWFCASISILCILLSVVQKERIYLLLASLAIAYFFYFGIFDGHLRMLWPGLPLWIERQGLQSIGLVIVFCLVRFVHAFLGPGSRPWVDRLQRLAQGCVVVAWVISLISRDYAYTIRWVHPLGSVALSTSILSALPVFFKSRDSIDWLFIINSMCTLVCTLYLVVQFAGVIPMLLMPHQILTVSVLTIFTSFFFAAIKRQQSLRDAELRLAESRKAEADAKLMALRYQLNPHFLFNTLTSIEALSGSHPDRIPSLIQRLATYLRVQLRPSPTMLTTFENELEGVRAYLEIEQLRFGDGLETNYDIDPAALGCFVPELILQPLVENAIKHGFRADSSIRLDITARVDRGMLRVAVTNPGKLNFEKTDEDSSSSSGFGIGMANMKQRLKAHFTDQASFQIRQRDGRVVAELVIPERREAT